MIKDIKPKWYIGIGVLIVTLIFFISGAVPLQVHLGMWGLALTELGILIIALIPVFVFNWELSEILPIKKITFKQLSAISLLFVATYFLVNTVSIITLYLFPDYAQTAESMADFFTTVPFVISLIIMSIMPGICEEVLHRGLIQHTLKDIKNPIILALVMAVIFGVFHLDLYRFLPTAIIGFVLSYIMIKTENILLPIIYHTMNNATSVVLSYGSGAEQPTVITRESIGVFFIITALSPFLFYFGSKFLNKEKPKRKAKYIVLAITMVLLSIGVGIIAVSPMRTPVTNFTFTENVNIETQPSIFGNIPIEKEQMYDMHISITDETHTVRTVLSFEHEDGEVIWETGGFDMFANKPTLLRVGLYRAVFTFETKSEQLVPVEVIFAIR